MTTNEASAPYYGNQAYIQTGMMVVTCAQVLRKSLSHDWTSMFCLECLEFSQLSTDRMPLVLNVYFFAEKGR